MYTNEQNEKDKREKKHHIKEQSTQGSGGHNQLNED